MKFITSLLLISFLLIGSATSGDQLETTTPDTNTVLIADTDPEEDPADPDPEEDPAPLPVIADYGILLLQHKFTPLVTARELPPQITELRIVETKIGTINNLDYIEMHAFPTDAQWFGTLFNWSGAVYNGQGSNVFEWPSALCVVTIEETKYLVGYRIHKITVQMDLKFHNIQTPDNVTVTPEEDGNKITVKIKDWEPDSPKYWKQSDDRQSVLPHDGEMIAHPTKVGLYLQTTGNRLDCRMAVILVIRNGDGKILVAGGIFTYLIENGELAFPTD